MQSVRSEPRDPPGFGCVRPHERADFVNVRMVGNTDISPSRPVLSVLLRPFRVDDTEAFEVSKHIGHVRNNTPELLNSKLGFMPMISMSALTCWTQLRLDGKRSVTRVQHFALIRRDHPGIRSSIQPRRYATFVAYADL